jgi:hypothetical protein
MENQRGGGVSLDSIKLRMVVIVTRPGNAGDTCRLQLVEKHGQSYTAGRAGDEWV